MMKNNWKNLQKHLSKLLLFTVFTFLAEAYEKEQFYSAEQVPEELKGLEVEEKLGSSIDLNLRFSDEVGQKVSLSHFFKNTKPRLNVYRLLWLPKPVWFAFKRFVLSY